MSIFHRKIYFSSFEAGNCVSDFQLQMNENKTNNSAGQGLMFLNHSKTPADITDNECALLDHILSERRRPKLIHRADNGRLNTRNFHHFEFII